MKNNYLIINSTNIFAQLAELILTNQVIRATKYLDKKTVITATRKRFQNKILKTGNIEILFKVGKPNYQENKFIKNCERTGEPFPVKKIQVKYVSSAGIKQ